MIAVHASCAKVVALVGDPQQLPATIISQHAAIGLQQSVMSRLMCAAPGSWLMLREQYRMHRALSEFPSNRFYDGQLINSATGQPDWTSERYLWYDTSNDGAIHLLLVWCLSEICCA